MVRRATKIGFAILATLVISFTLFAGWNYPPLGVALGLPPYAEPFPHVSQVSDRGLKYNSGVIYNTTFYRLALVSQGEGSGYPCSIKNIYQISAIQMTSGTVLWTSQSITLCSDSFLPQILGFPDSASPTLYALSGIVLFIGFADSISFESQNVSHFEYVESSIALNGSNGNLLAFRSQPISTIFGTSAFSTAYEGIPYFGYATSGRNATMTVYSIPILTLAGKNATPGTFSWQTNITISSNIGFGLGNDLILAEPN